LRHRMAASPSLPVWAEGWARYKIGSALLREQETVRRQAGMLDLLHLPARFGRTLPALSAMALAAVADALEGQGQSDSAVLLRAELRQNFPEYSRQISAGRRNPDAAGDKTG